MTFLQSIHCGERQIRKAPAELATAAESDQFRQLLTQHREETPGSIGRLQQVFDQFAKRAVRQAGSSPSGQFGKRARGTRCEAIQG